MDRDVEIDLQQRVQDAIGRRVSLLIAGGDSKRFYGRVPTGESFSVGGHRGVVRYEPTELVLTARAGTPLEEVETVLAEHGQMLGFEPPHFGDTATLGGTIACGFSGPRRMYAGAARDFVLGVSIINGEGEILRFGGEVMKNVAGYDVARLMTGALGTLGVLLEISLKVLPRPAAEMTLALDMDANAAIAQMNRWSGQALPLSASCHDGARLYVRLSGTETGVRAAHTRIGGEDIRSGDHFWHSLREQEHHFFHGDEPLWRLAVAPSSPNPGAVPGRWLIDWCGGQRWLKSRAPAPAIRQAARAAGGHATCFRGGERSGEVFQSLPPALAGLHARLKRKFDPLGIFNPGRMVADW